MAADNTFWLNTFEEHGSPILAFLTSRVGRRDVAEDLLQETFVRAMRRSATIDTSRIRAYLFTTAHRLVLDRARRARTTLFSEMSNDRSDPDTMVADAGTKRPDEATELRLLRDRLQKVLAGLSAAHRAAFEAAVLEQRPYAEIAELRGWTLQQVKSNVHRARKRVIEQLRHGMAPIPETES